jgi:hypothetical protein
MIHNENKNNNRFSIYLYVINLWCLQSECFKQPLNGGQWLHTLGGVVVSVLATGPKVRGFKPGRGRWILRVIKSVARIPSEGK